LGVACLAGAIAGDVVVLSVNGRKTTMTQLTVGAGVGCVGGAAVAVGTAAVMAGAAWSELTALGTVLATQFDKITRLVNNQIGAMNSNVYAQLKLPTSARTTTEAAEIFRRLERFHGISEKLASQRLHAIKEAAGRGPSDNVLFDLTGNVYNPATREWLGSLTQGGAKVLR